MSCTSDCVVCNSELEAEAILSFGKGYDGEGWYYWDAEYPDEGSIGAFASRDEAIAYARSEDGGGYTKFLE